MKLHIPTLVLATLLSCGSIAQAGVITFDNPGAIVIDPVTNVASYSEAGFVISGDAATFLTLADGLVGFSGAPLSLKPEAGGLFSLFGLDSEFFDIGFDEVPGDLSVTGLLDGVPVVSTLLALGSSASTTFGSDWAKLTEVSFIATSAFKLDNIAANGVPEPGSAALVALALLGLAMQGGRRRRA